MIATMIRAAALAAFLAGVAATGGLAQQPAPAAAPSASHLAAAREMGLLLKLDEPLKVVLDEMQLQVTNTLTLTRPELTNDLKQVLTSMNQEVAAKREEMFTKGVRIFADRFTEPEIIELTKFLKTPLGEKYLRTQPEAFTAYLREVQDWVGGLNAFVITRVRDEMKKKGHTL